MLVIIKNICIILRIETNNTNERNDMHNTKFLNVGENRGKPRVWIEGNFLKDNGIIGGSKVELIITDNCINLFSDTDKPNKKISGSPERPIIDISGAKLTKIGLKVGDKIEIIAKNGVLVFRKA